MEPADRMAPIAIVGISVLFPGSDGLGGFWRDIVGGRDLIEEIPPEYWLKEDYFDPHPGDRDKVCSNRGACLSPVDFDALGFALPPRLLASTDSSQLLALVAASRLWSQVRATGAADIDRNRVGVILGASATALAMEMAGRLQRPIWVKAMREAGLPEDRVQDIAERMAASYAPWTESTFPGLLSNVVAGRIANRLDLGGTNCVLDAACASSLAAVDMAAMELTLGKADLVITGGVDAMNDAFMYMCFSKTGALSPTGDARPFAADADGTVLGEGVGLLALRRLEDAERDGQPVHAVLRGIGSSSDGQAKSVYAPRAEGQVRALRRAYAAAGYEPRTVGLVEAHGTGTRAGDAAEFHALREAFVPGGAEVRPWCALGSIKSQIGHTKGAAGAAGLIKAVLALRSGILPPTIKVQAPNPQLALDTSPFYLNTEARPWIHGGEAPRRAAVSSFGFGGTNFHVTLEEYRGPGGRAPRVRAVAAELLLFGAEDPVVLAQRAEEAAADLERPAGREAAARAFANRARRSQATFAHTAPVRLALVATHAAEAASLLRQAAERVRRAPAAGFADDSASYSGLDAPAPGRLALLFPGQGSQYPGMGAGLAMAFEEARAVWDAAAGLPLAADGRLDEVVFPVPAFTEAARRAQADRLARTEWAQPALGAAGLAALAVLRRAGCRPDFATGHSFGELTALAAAGSLRADDLLRAARRRGELMAEAGGGSGAMTSAFCGPERIRSLLSGDGAVIANYNAPEQVVVSGSAESVGRLEARLRAADIRFQRLPVSAAFHSPFVRPAASAFAAYLEGVALQPPSLPVFGTGEAGTSPAYPAEPAEIRSRMAAQIGNPVRFIGQIEALHDAGVRTFVEVGPGAVLTGLVARILEGRPHLAVSLDRRGHDGVATLWRALGRLAAAGVALRCEGLWDDDGPPEDAAEAEPRRSALPIAIAGPNYGRPYPPAGGAAALPPPNPPARAEQPAPRASAPARNGAPSPVPGSRPGAEPYAPLGSPGGDAAPTWPAGPSVDGPPAAAAAEPSAGREPASTAAIAAFQEMSRQAAAAQESFERVLGESHALFLRAAEASVRALSTILGGGAGAGSLEPPPAEVAGQVPGAAAPVPAAVMEGSGEPPREAWMPLPPAPTPAQRRDDMALASAPVRDPAPVHSAPRAGTNPDARSVLLEVVADKTGYPADMLDLDLDLESGLGIDSIKRVEILSALQERLPDLPAVEPADLAGLSTLRQILDFSARPSGGGAATAAPPAAVPSLPRGVRRAVVEAVPAPPAGFALGRLRAAGVLAVTDDGAGVADGLVACLAEAGVAARRVPEVPADASGAILLDGLRRMADATEAERVNRDAFAAARVLSPRATETGVLFVTVQDTGGDFGLSGRAGHRAWSAGLTALAKTAAREWPRASVRAIDIESGGRSPALVARALAGELLGGGPELEVGLPAQGGRLTLRARPAALMAEPALPLGAGDVVLASGGARGVTAACLLALAGAAAPKIAILGRSPLDPEPPALAAAHDQASLQSALLGASGGDLTPAELGRQARAVLARREARQNLEALRRVGAEVLYVAADVRDPAAVARAVARVHSAWGQVTALIHGAGIIADKPIAGKGDEQFERVFQTKVGGLKALLAATARDPLRLLCVFSSAAARDGNAGQADYAMANEVLNRVAAAEARRRGGGCLVKAIGWGPWEGGMVTAFLQRHFAERGIPLLPVADGARHFLAEIASPPGDPVEVLVAAGGDGATLEAASDRSAEAEVSVSASGHPYLADHRVHGVAVLPAVLVLEWFARTAAAVRPAGTMVALQDIRVLRGVPLPDLVAGVRLTIAAEAVRGDAGPRLTLRLLDAGGQVRYGAVALPAGDGSPPLAPAAIGGGPWSQTALSAYEDLLFHGPRFRALRDTLDISREGAESLVEGTAALGWPGGPWRTDPARMDGGLQLARVWSWKVLGGPTLPTRIGAFVAYGPGPSAHAGPLRCVLRGRRAGAHQTVCDITFQDGDGAVVARLGDVEMTRAPEERA